MKKREIAIKMPLRELISEHKLLVAVLRADKSAQIKAELRKQLKELKSYEKRKGGK